MRKIYIEKFSCIEQAEIELSNLTVIVGPQASGKSVITKLAFFFLTLQTDHYELLREQANYVGFTKHVKKKFSEWFPVSAWGKGEFVIEFTAGAFQGRVTRSKRGGRVSDNLRIWFCQPFREHYDLATKLVEEGQPKADDPEDFERYFEVEEAIRKNFRRVFGDEYMQFPLFVPAGRAFFTSMGRAVALFEKGGVLDPVTARFGRLYANLRDRGTPQVPQQLNKLRHALLQRIQNVLGGEPRKDREGDYLQTTDGRKVPFTAMSSGQQELLPLLQIGDYWLRNRGRAQLVCIEEPEAHLFPKAQSELVEALTMLLRVSARSGLILTTHSPYVLAKLNCLVKAGQLESKYGDAIAGDLEKIVPKGARLPVGSLRAYAICEGTVRSICDPFSLIEADYLDEVSSEIAHEFERLLSLERAKMKEQP